MFAAQFHGVRTILSFQNEVAERRQILYCHFPKYRIVFSDQYGFRSHAPRALGAGFRALNRIDSRKINVECRTPPGLAVSIDMPAALRDDAVRDGESEAQVFFSRLGAEEWFVEMLEDIRRHTASSVLHREAHVSPGRYEP